ncbi:MAG: AMP-binding protein [Myxococcota bacterium]
MADSRAFFEALEQHPAREAFHVGGEILTYGDLERRAAAWARGLEHLGVRRGDRVAFFGPSCPELLVALVGHLRAGLIHVPINTRYRDREIRHILTDSGASVLVAAQGSAALETARDLGPERGPVHRVVFGGPPAEGEHTFDDIAGRPPEERPPYPSAGDVALLIYTSGTTGRSKGVALAHGALTANLSATTGLWRWTAEDRLVLALPLFHVHGLGLGVLGTLLHGMTTLVHGRFDPARVVDDVEHRGGTVFMGVPTMYARLLAWLDEHPERAEALRGARLFTSGSAALPARDLEAFQARTGHRILERYGMSETGFTLSNPYDGERRAGTVGFPVPGYEVRVVDDAGDPVEPGQPGEIEVRGDGLMSGYWGRPEETENSFRGGWFVTGDVATVDPDGYHRIVGRKSVDIIKSGGFKISAREIEDVVAAHPAVAEAAVVGVPDPTWGERISAAVVPAPDAETTDEARLLATLAEHVGDTLADYKKPRALRILDALPRNALGKVQKHRLKPLFE